MLKKTEGIVIQSIKYGDSGRIIHIYSHTEGLKSFIAQGLNSKNNLKKSYFQHLNIIDFTYYSKEKSKLYRLKDSKIQKDNSELPIDKLYLPIMAAEFIKSSIKEEEANAALYNFVKSWILHLHVEQNPGLLSLIDFCLELSSYLGFYPLNNHSQYFNLVEGCFVNNIVNASHTLSLEESLLLKNFMNGQRNMDENGKKELLNIILRFYSYHLHNFHEPKSLQMLETLYSE